MNRDMEPGFSHTTPEEQGVSSQAILDFVEEIEEKKLEMHGLMILRNKHCIAKGWWAPFHSEEPHIIFSVTKSFTATAVGLAVEEGLLSLNDTVISYFSDEITEEIKENMRDMKIKDLLSMTTGHTQDTTRIDIHPGFLQDEIILKIGERADGDWVRGFFEQPITESPGTFFLYNSGASHLLSVIVEKITNQSLLDYLQPRLFAPLGIETPLWEKSPKGETSGGWGMRLKTEDIAKLGQLFLDNGMWRGKQVLSKEWVQKATQKQTETVTHQSQQGITGKTDWEQGYGYQFWMCRHNCYRADGALGQYSIVMPDANTVIAINSGTDNMQDVLDAVWKHLLPAMKEAKLPKNEKLNEALQNKLSNLELGEKRGTAFEENGKVELRNNEVKHYKLKDNPKEVTKISFALYGNQSNVFSWVDSKGEYNIHFNIDSWNTDNVLAGEKTAAKGTWISENTLVLDLYQIQTPFRDKLIFTFTDNEVAVTRELVRVGEHTETYQGKYVNQ